MRSRLRASPPCRHTPAAPAALPGRPGTFRAGGTAAPRDAAAQGWAGLRLQRRVPRAGGEGPPPAQPGGQPWHPGKPSPDPAACPGWPPSPAHLSAGLGGSGRSLGQSPPKGGNGSFGAGGLQLPQVRTGMREAGRFKRRPAAVRDAFHPK